MKQGSTFAWALASLLGCAPEPVTLRPGDDATTRAPSVPAQRDDPRGLVEDAAMGRGDTPARPPDAGPSRDVTVPPEEDAVGTPPPEDAPREDLGSDPSDAVMVDMDVVNPPRDVVNPVTDVGNPLRDVGNPPRDVGNPPRDVVSPVTDVGGGVSWRALVGVPRVDARLKSALRALYLRGVAMGNRAAVFAKVGDSITESASFLSDFGPARGGSWDLGAWGALDPTRAFFSATLVDAAHSSFDRESLCAVSGWSTGRALMEGESLIRDELRTLRPAVAFVMFGSADIEVLDVSELGVFRANLARIVRVVAGMGVIPVLSTVPDRSDSPTAVAQSVAFVGAIRDVAAAEQVPLQDYWAALQPLPNRGVSDDGVHPSVYRTADGNPEAAFFTAPALAYGYNLRNLIALATLAHLRAVVFEDGPPDP